MKILCWNVRGLGSSVKKGIVKKLVIEKQIQMLMLYETKPEKVEYNIIQSLWADENFEWVSIASKGRSGGLITMWDKSSFKLE